MEDFRLGDRIMWLPQKETAIIIDLLEYDGERRGMIGILLDTSKEMHAAAAKECVLYQPEPEPDPLEVIDAWLANGGQGFPQSDCY